MASTVRLALLLLAYGPALQAADLRIALAADVTSVDPHFANIAPNNNIGWHVFDALTHVDADARLVPGLAVSWRAVDGTTWEFRMRRGVKFHDGGEFTAEDVVFSIERAAKLPNGQFAGFVQRIVAKQIVDPYTLRLKTATPYAMVPQDLNSIFIVSRKAAASAATEDFNSGRAIVGTGPFRFVAFRRGERDAQVGGLQSRSVGEQEEGKADCRGHDRSLIEAGEGVCVLIETSMSVEFPWEEFMTRQFDVVVMVEV